jgi:hypothetical protein
MKRRTWLTSLGAALLVFYGAFWGFVFYISPPILLVGYIFQEDRIAFAPPDALVLNTVVCCKDIGREGEDEHGLIRGLVGAPLGSLHKEVSIKKAKQLMRKLVLDRELGVNSVDPRTGMTPLHEAVLIHQVWAIDTLLDLGADPCIRINSAKSNLDGKNAVELAMYLTGENQPTPKESFKEKTRQERELLAGYIPKLEQASIDCSPN